MVVVLSISIHAPPAGCNKSYVTVHATDCHTMSNLSHSIRKRLARLKSFPQVKRIDDAIFLLDPANWIDNRLLADVPFEAEQIAYVKSRIADLPIATVIDIGANFGLYAVTMGLLSKISSVIAFEPVSQNFNQLCGNVFVNRLNGKVTTHRCALGSFESALAIHINPQSTGVSRFDLKTADRDASVFTEAEFVTIKRGDDVLPDCRHSGVFIKIDVEGHSAEVLRGMPNFLSSTHGLIQMETDADDDATFHILDGHGWHFSHRIGGDNYFEKRS